MPLAGESPLLQQGEHVNQKLDAEGLRVTLITEVADDTGGDVAYLERQMNRQDVSITALREDAIKRRGNCNS